MEELLSNKWVIKGGIPIERVGDVVTVSESEIESAVIPIHRVAFIKSIIKQWKHKAFSHEKLNKE